MVTFSPSRRGNGGSGRQPGVMHESGVGRTPGRLGVGWENAEAGPGRSRGGRPSGRKDRNSEQLSYTGWEAPPAPLLFFPQKDNVKE